MLPKTAEYALRAVVWFAREPKELSRRTTLPNTPRCRAGICIRCCRTWCGQAGALAIGPRRRLALARAPKKITILDVVNATAPLERIRHCPLGLRRTRGSARCTASWTTYMPRRKRRCGG